MNLNEKLNKIQVELKSPKNQKNNFGGYMYRSCEDILEALKPHLKELKVYVAISDDLRRMGDRFYIIATASIIDCESTEKISVSALAREPESQKGMNDAQLTGSASSYARKYALNGLFLIDDTKDDDAQEAPKSGGAKPKVKSVNDTVDDFNKSLDKDIKDELITEEQKGRIKGVLLELGKKPEYLEEQIKKSINELGKEEANKIIKGLFEKLLEKKKGERIIWNYH